MTSYPSESSSQVNCGEGGAWSTRKNAEGRGGEGRGEERRGEERRQESVKLEIKVHIRTQHVYQPNKSLL